MHASVMVVTTAQLHLAESQLKLVACLNSASNILEVYDDENLRWLPRQEKRHDLLLQSTIPRNNSLSVHHHLFSISIFQFPLTF